MRDQKSLKPFMGFRAARRRVWGFCFILAVMALLGFNASTAQEVPEIDEALPCGRGDSLPPGNVVFRVNVNLANFPNAICNDGSGAVFFVRRYTNEADRNKWQIHLQGGGACGNGQACAERWCSVNTNFGADEMSTTFKPLPAGMATGGILNPNAGQNDFAGWNHVLAYYCSSDGWAGTARDVVLSTTGPMGNMIQYRIHFEGANIFDAVIKTLQRLLGPAVECRNAQGETVMMPDLDEATDVLFTGASAGAAGVKHHADRLQDMLRRDNVHCRQPGNCPLVFRAVLGAGNDASTNGLNYANTSLCQSGLCDYSTHMQHLWDNVFKNTWGTRGDQSCQDWHRANQLGTEWMCADLTHVVQHHVTTPFLMRQDLQDQLFLSSFVETGFGTADNFGRIVYNQFLNLPNLDRLAEEGSVMGGGPPLVTPGTFGPQCGQHVGMTGASFWIPRSRMLGTIRTPSSSRFTNSGFGKQRPPARCSIRGAPG